MAKKIKQNKNKNKNKTAVKKMEEKIKLEKSRSKYASGKLCKIVDRQIADYKVFDLKTPFGKAIIQKRTKNNSFVLKNPGDYEGIVNKINASGENTVGNIKKILKYLSIKSNGEMKDIDSFNDEISKKMTMPDDIKSQALTNLCGVLMFSEPYRFNDGGGLSRGAIRYIYINLKSKNIDKAISKALGGEIDPDKLLFSTEGGKKSVDNIIEKAKKQINSKKNKYNDVYDDNMGNMKMEYVSDDEDYEDDEDGEEKEENDKKEYSLRRKGLSDEENKIYKSAINSKLYNFIKNKRNNMKSRKTNRKRRRIRGIKLKLKNTKTKTKK